jgi:hypothetical protein
MTQGEENNTLPLGLDIGTSRIVLAHRDGDGFECRSELNAFTTIPYTKLTEGVLKKESVPHTVQGQEIVVYGNEAARFADLAHKETRRPMVNGMVNPSEPGGLALIRNIIQHLAGAESGSGRKMCFSVPAPVPGGEDNVKYHEAALRDVLGSMGYEVMSINEGLAVVYSELEDTNYTGIGISFGGGMCNVALAYLSVPVTSFSVPRAGDFIDASAAAATGESANRIRMLKEQSFKFDGNSPDRIQQAMSVYYDDMNRNLLQAMEQAFADARMLPKLHRPVPLVLSGGSAMPEGFRERFEQALRASDFPIELSEIRMAADPLNSTAKGALVAALADM